MPRDVASVAIILVLVLASAGCTGRDAESSQPAATATLPSSAPPAAGSLTRVASPEAPLRVALELEDARAFYAEGTRLALVVSGAAADDVRAGVALPGGVEVVTGALAFEGALGEGETRTLDAVVRAREPGTYVLRAWAERAMGVGSRAAPSALLSVEGDADEARAGAASAGAPAFRVALTGDATRVRALVEGDVASATRVVVVVPDVFPATRGPHEHSLQLEPGRASAVTMDLGPADAWEEGYVEVAVHLYPDPAVDGRLYSDSLYVWREGGELRAGETPP